MNSLVSVEVMHERLRRAVWICGILLFCGAWAHARAEDPGRVESIEADESRVYVHESKKIEVRARITGIATDETGPKWNLVQVDAEGRILRYLGILYFSPKKGAFFRKLELQEREPGVRYFEVVPDSELEPFVIRQRARLVIQVAGRPSLPEILRSVWRKVFGANLRWKGSRAIAGELDSLVIKERPCMQKIEGAWSVWSAESELSLIHI